MVEAKEPERQPLAQVADGELELGKAVDSKENREVDCKIEQRERLWPNVHATA